ncbi:substrate-binding domain-containing protein [Herbiconiux moechotypicola]|uniref:ABC transporter substrate-binding protein n=1 Tax=Herbiconiux moechotypicola TaxID=637393 RepID=A0ABN3DRP7_9MICO|nr:substrate-binding domain-containing protein [Herbiconiux moechotypicola]MCS5730670.1 substrate-binding domain-containing protein [Herbiconiux moechotypicola]
MARQRTVWAAAATAALALTLTACASGGSAEPTSTESRGAVALSFPAPSQVPIWSEVLELMPALVAEAGYEFVSDDPNLNSQVQVSDWQAWIQRGDVKAIMGYPAAADALVPVTAEANAAGIPVLGYTLPWEGTAGVLLSDGYADGYQVGVDAGEWVAETYGTDAAVPVTLLGYWDNDFGRERSTGLSEGLLSVVPNAVVNEVVAPTLDDGYSGVQNALAAAPDTKVWLAFDAASGLGAYQALLDSGVSETAEDTLLANLDVDTQVAQVLADPDTFWRVSYGATAADIAALSAELLIAAAEGEPQDGELVQRRVTADNAAEFAG